MTGRRLTDGDDEDEAGARSTAAAIAAMPRNPDGSLGSFTIAESLVLDKLFDRLETGPPLSLDDPMMDELADLLEHLAERIESMRNRTLNREADVDIPTNWPGPG